MRTSDLTTGAAKLEDAVETLRAAWMEAGQHWDDETRRAFEERYIEPLQPRVNRALDAIHRLADVLGKAGRECSDT